MTLFGVQAALVLVTPERFFVFKITTKAPHCCGASSLKKSGTGLTNASLRPFQKVSLFNCGYSLTSCSQIVNDFLQERVYSA